MKTDEFVERHVGPNEREIKKILATIGAESIEQLLKETIPEAIRLNTKLNLPKGISEYAFSRKTRSVKDS